MGTRFNDLISATISKDHAAMAALLDAGGGFLATTATNGSGFYSFTDLTTAGTLTIGTETYRVTGTSWMDHEFGTSFLEPAQVGWDWLSLQLDDGSDLMVFRLRRQDGTVDPQSSGTLVEPDGTTRALNAPAAAANGARRRTAADLAAIEAAYQRFTEDSAETPRALLHMLAFFRAVTEFNK